MKTPILTVIFAMIAMALASTAQANDCKIGLEPIPPALQSISIDQRTGIMTIYDRDDVQQLQAYIQELRSGYKKRPGTPPMKSQK